MKKFLLACLCSIALMTAFANGVFKGTVRDARTAEPLQGATVRLLDRQGKDLASVVSGLDGSFSFRDLPAAAAQVEVSFLGYVTLRRPVSTSSSIIFFDLVPEGRQMAGVVVAATGDRGSDAATHLAERRADNIINTVSARAIEVSPDLSVANVTQRVSGVSLQRSNNGEGQYAIVRGMDKRYNYTLVNGIKIPSPDNKNRYVPLDIFPAELLDRLEVAKALTPNMEGDAIGGAINLVMKEAPAHFTLNAHAGISEAQSFLDGKNFITFDRSASSSRSPRDRNGDSYAATLADFPNNPFHYSTKGSAAFNGGLSAGGRLLHQKLGILVAASMQNSNRDVRTLFFNTETSRVDNSPSFTSIQRRNYSIAQNRAGLHGFLDYTFNEQNKLKLYLAYLSLAQDEYRFASDTNLVLGRVGPGSGRIGNTIRSTRQVQHIYTATLKGDHQLTKALSVSWAAAYSKATGNQPDRASLALSTGVTKDAGGNLQQQPVYIDNSTFRDWSRNSDEDKSAYLNLTYTSLIGKAKLYWTAGGMYRDKDRRSTYDNYNLRPSPSPQAYNDNIDANSFAVFNPQGSSTDPLNYTASEKVGAYYGMVKADVGKLQVIGGARVEYTSFNWVTFAPKTVEGADGKITYNDVLPSVHIKYKLSAKQYLRASYFSSISRPGFYEITPHTYVDPNADYPEQGNPYLKRTTAENFDLRYEYFPKGIDQVLAGAFYKRIDNPIEYAIVQRGAGNTYYSPANFGTGSNYGFELDVTRYFHSFGVRANYTFTSSEITTSKIRRFQKTDPGGGTSLTQEDVMQTRPLQGQSKHMANLSLLYKSGGKGIDAQLAAVYTGTRINTVSPFLDNDIWQKGFVQLDFSTEVRLARRFFVFAKLNNLLDTPYRLEIHQKNTATAGIPYQEAGENAFVRKDTYGANYLLGLRFKL